MRSEVRGDAIHLDPRLHTEPVRRNELKPDLTSNVSDSFFTGLTMDISLAALGFDYQTKRPYTPS